MAQKTLIRVTDYTDDEIFDRLYHESALTFEGMAVDEENLNDIMNWLDLHNGIVNDNVSFVTITGRAMNRHYHLSGRNKYPDDLTILCIEKYGDGVILPRFEVGGRWFDDIVDNNRRREER